MAEPPASSSAQRGGSFLRILPVSTVPARLPSRHAEAGVADCGATEAVRRPGIRGAETTAGPQVRPLGVEDTGIPQRRTTLGDEAVCPGLVEQQQTPPAAHPGAPVCRALPLGTSPERKVKTPVST